MQRTVLVVEDDADLRRMFRQALTFAGFAVQEAADGYSALAFLDERARAAVVLDLGLPIISGYVVLQEIAAQAHLRNSPVIVVTGQQSARVEEGAACLLRKPVTPERLVSTVRSCIAEGTATEQS